MPRSILLGRPLPGPGEVLFTVADTAAVVALAEEEADTCQQCGYPRAWCRDPANQFGVFEPHEEFCWASYRLADYRRGKQYGESQQAAVQLSARIREGREPDLIAGLGLPSGSEGAEGHADGPVVGG